jgi:prevent-host-death family protein
MPEEVRARDWGEPIRRIVGDRESAYSGQNDQIRCVQLAVPTQSPTNGRTPRHSPRHWPLRDAKTHFSQLVRRARSEGPQHVTVHGRDEVVVIAADEYRRLKGGGTGRALIDALQASPYRDVELEPERMPMSVRHVEL